MIDSKDIIPHDGKRCDIEALPEEIKTAKRFFKVTIIDGKKIGAKQWSTPSRQRYAENIKAPLLGFDICGHGSGPDYMVFDFDHVLDQDGSFNSPTAEKAYKKILSLAGGTWAEVSISGDGVHVVVLPTPGKFKAITNDSRGVLHFPDGKKGAKLEMFYLSSARYFLFTGYTFRDAPAVVSNGAGADSAIEWAEKQIAAQIAKAEKENGKASKQKTATPAQQEPKDQKREAAKEQDPLPETLPDPEKVPDDYRVKAMLAALPCEKCSYPEWVNVGMVIHDTEGLSLADWDEWSATDTSTDKDGNPRYKGIADLETHWKTFKQNGSAAGKVSIGTLYNYAITKGNYNAKATARAWYQENDLKRFSDLGADEGQSEGGGKSSRFQWIDTYIDWRNKVRPIVCSYKNVAQVLEMEGLQLSYNSLKREINLSFFKEQQEDMIDFDDMLTEIKRRCHNRGLKVQGGDLKGAVVLLAHKNKYNPVQAWLKAVRPLWDGQDYIEKLFSKLHLKAGQNIPLLKTLFRKWFIGSVKMAFNDSGKEGAEGVLILCGPQAAHKTRFVLGLSPEREWVEGGQNVDPGNKDDVMKVSKFWITELGEVGQTLRRERRDKLKAFFTAGRDVLRVPYGRRVEDFPRYTTFIGTLNNELDEGFLTDSTGSRRFWPIMVNDIDDPTTWDFPLEQLWACAMAAAENESMRLTKEERSALAIINLQYDKITSEERTILDMLDWGAPGMMWRKITPAALCIELDINNSKANRVGRALSHISQMDKRVLPPTNNKNRSYFLPPKLVTDFQQPLTDENIIQAPAYKQGHF